MPKFKVGDEIVVAIPARGGVTSDAWDIPGIVVDTPNGCNDTINGRRLVWAIWSDDTEAHFAFEDDVVLNS